MSRRDHFFDGPDRAVRFAHGMHHRLHRRGRGRPPALVGVVLLVLGVLFLLDNLNLIEARDLIRTYWPTLLVAWGCARFVFGRGGERIVGGIAIAAGGILLGNQLLGWDVDVWDLFWPLLLIVLGAHFLFHRLWHGAPARGAASPPPGASVIDAEPVDDQPETDVDSSATFRELAIMANVERRNISQTFRGGRVTAFMGAVEIDLRECRMASNEAHVDVFVMMGEVVFRIPRDWTVDSRMSVVLANLEDRSEVPADASSKRFVVQGSAFMGNVEIRN